MTITPRARKLWADLHDVASNEKGWAIVQAALDEERAEGRVEMARPENDRVIDAARAFLAGAAEGSGERSDDWGV